MQVQTTVSSEKDARKIANASLEAKLAACVQILPCRSQYHWLGKVEEEQEFLCVLKTRRDLFDRLQALLCTLHPYEVPEILALEIVDGHAPYLQWLDQELDRTDIQP
ncbi:MAG: cytochrome C biogenesis protein CcdA [Desulfobulbus propionicus]|nr:MAG: cytochrome C biogenesis protein CcdA [Desulfobulbus propionicus]